MRSSLIAGAILVIAGCAAADTSSSKHGQEGQGAGKGGDALDGAVGSDSASGGFGNGDGKGIVPAMMTDAAACEVGKFCAPTTPDPSNCGSLTLKGDVKTVEKPGNVLLIFDRSGSMTQDWNGMPKWQQAGNAMIAALMPLQDKLTIGAVLFPSPADPKAMSPGGTCSFTNLAACLGGIGGGGGGCGVNPISSPDQVTFKAGAMAITELQSGGAGGAPKYQPLAQGGTPTSEGIQQADAALNGATLMGTTAAVVITDGEPNCMWNQQTSVTTIGNWLSKKNIKTYVVGLPGAGFGNGTSVLTALAQAGNTMDYIPASDTMTLQKKISEIVSQTVSVGFDSCTIHLDPPAKVPNDLHLVIKNKGVEQDVPHKFPGQTANAWTITSDGKTVELLGDLCKNVKAGTYEEINFKFGCVKLPPLPPPPKPT